MRVAGLLLAAGAGRRMGRPKALVELGGVSLVERGVDLLAAGGCRPVLVVVGAAGAQVTDLVERLPAGHRAARDVRVVHSPDWASGLGASLRAGLRAATATEAEAVVVTLVDQPRLGAAAVTRLIAVAAGPGPPDAAVATYGGRPAHPVLLGRRVWAEVAAGADGEAGARGWLRAHPDRVSPVPCDGTGSPDDVDTAAALAAVDPREDGDMDVTVTDNPGRSRYEARTREGAVAGFVQYQKREDRVILVHTEVLPDFEGQGVASQLARGALDHVRGLGLAVVPTCPYISAYIGKHPDYADLVADGTGSTTS